MADCFTLKDLSPKKKKEEEEKKDDYLLLFTALLNVHEVQALPEDPPKIEARRRGKQQKGRRRGGNGLR